MLRLLLQKLLKTSMPTPKIIKNKNGTTSYKMTIQFTADGVVKRETRTFSKRQLAVDWADKRKKEFQYASVHGEQNSSDIKSLIEKYLEQFGANYGRSKNYDLARLLHYPIANIAADKLTPNHIIQHIVERNKTVKPQTALNDVIWLRTVIKTMSAINGFQFNDGVFETALTVLKKEKLVARSTCRERLPTFSEMLRITRHFKRSRTTLPMIDLIWFAYFSARRLSEITRLEWSDNNEKMTGMVRDAKHPTMKKGNNLRFKYEKSAWKIVNRQPKKDTFIFPYNPKTISTLFDRACRILEIHDLHFHDLRHAATTRLFSKGYSIEQVQKFTLHSDWKTLARYTQLKPEDIKTL